MEVSTEKLQPDPPLTLTTTLMDFSPSADLTKPVDLSNNNNHTGNNNLLEPEEEAEEAEAEEEEVEDREMLDPGESEKAGGVGGEVVFLTGENGVKGKTVENGGGRKLSFSVENILDPNKFTGRTFGLHSTPKSILSTSDLLHGSHPAPNFRFPFKDLHGRFLIF